MIRAVRGNLKRSKVVVGELLQPLNGGERVVNALHGWAMTFIALGVQPTMEVYSYD